LSEFSPTALDYRTIDHHFCRNAIAMKGGSPFGVAGLWENWKSPSGEWVRTFAIITTDSNELVGQMHDRMPVILHRPIPWGTSFRTLTHAHLRLPERGMLCVTSHPT
jgi:hypothetical protein